MVANLPYLQAADHAGGPNVVFAKASGSRPRPRSRVAAATRADGTTVKNIDQQTQQTVSSITTVDLRGISQIEEAFAIVLAAAAMALFVALAVIERRHEFATMAARRRLRCARSARSSGARRRSCSAPGSLLAAGLGWLLAEMLVAMLQHVFDPPPDHLAIPWAYLAELAGAAVAATTLAVAITATRLRRLPLGRLLREQ